MPSALQLRRELDDLPRAGLGVVGVDQQDHAFRPRAREILECRHLVVVHLHERMRHGADDRDAVAFAGEHVRGATKPGDIASTCRKQPGLGAVRGAQTEIRENFSRRGEHHARGFRGDHGLEVQDVDEPRLDDLRHRQGRGDADQRLVGKTDGAFRDGVHVAGEAERREVIDEIVAEALGAFQPVNLTRRETQRLEIGEDIVEAGGKKKAAPFRQAAHEELEHGLLVLAAVQIGLDHVELVEVGGERTFGGCHSALHAAVPLR